MKLAPTQKQKQEGKIGKVLLLWMIGIPLPIALLIIFLGGCN